MSGRSGDIVRKQNPLGTLPLVELNGQTFVQSYAILRRFARLLGQYEGETDDDKYRTDALCDMAADCAFEAKACRSIPSDETLLDSGFDC